MKTHLLAACLLFPGWTLLPVCVAADRPHVIVIQADGIQLDNRGDAKTPALDVLEKSVIRLTNFHAHPLSAPRQARLLTGRPALRAGIWQDGGGGSFLPQREVTVAEAGIQLRYHSGFFGDWKLGDYPEFWPENQGFVSVLTFSKGPLERGNSWLRHNGMTESFPGDANDRFVDTALEFMKLKVEEGHPFLCWISLDLEGNSHPGLLWFDQQIDRIEKTLSELKIVENTILVIVSKPSRKSERSLVFEENHLASCWWRHPARKIGEKKLNDGLSADIDVYRTLAQQAPLSLHNAPPVTGKNISHRIRPNKVGDHLENRRIVLGLPRNGEPAMYGDAVVMEGKDRWIHRVANNGGSISEFFNLKDDPGQNNDLSGEKEPQKRLRSLREKYGDWWTANGERSHERTAIPIGGPGAGDVRLSAYDFAMEKFPRTRAEMINFSGPSLSKWLIDVWEEGEFELTFHLLPDQWVSGMEIGWSAYGVDRSWANIHVEDGLDSYRVKTKLLRGVQELRTNVRPSKSKPVYFVDVRRLEGKKVGRELTNGKVGGAPSSFRPVFKDDGQKNWKQEGPAKWEIQDSVIMGKGNSGTIESRLSFRNFSLRLNYRLVSGAAKLVIGSDSEENDLSIPLTKTKESEELFITVRNGSVFVEGQNDDASLKVKSGPIKIVLSSLAADEPAEVDLQNCEILEYGEVERLSSHLDSLGYTEDFQKPFIQAHMGWTSTHSNGRIENRYLYGFLKQGGPGSPVSELALLDLEPCTHKSKPAGDDPASQPEAKVVSHDLAEYAKTVLEREWSSSKSSRADAPIGCVLDAPSYAAILSVALRKNGEWELADQLLNKARHSGPNDEWLREPHSFSRYFEEQLGKLELRNAIAANGNLETPRKEVEAILVAVTNRYPGSTPAREATIFLQALSQSHELKSEDPFLDDAQLEKLPIKERVTELIHQLETQNGRQTFSPGRCDIFNDNRGENSPASKLVKIGYPAVPQLLDSLHDPRPSRSKSVGDWVGSTLHVGECAKAVLEKIAGKRFSTHVHSVHNGQQRQAEKAAREWWKSIDGKTEFDILADAIREAKDDAPHKAVILQQKFGLEKSLPIIQAAAEKSVELSVRGMLITLVAKSGIESAGDFLRKEMLEGRFAYTRTRAAAALYVLGEEEAVMTAMIKQWRARRDAKFPGEGSELSRSLRAGQLGYAGEFLTSFVTAKGISSLGEDWNSLPRPIRYSILSKLTPDSFSFASKSDFLGIPAPPTLPPENTPELFRASTGYPGGYRLETFTGKGNVPKARFTIVKPAPVPADVRVEMDALLFKTLSDSDRRFRPNSYPGGESTFGEFAAKLLAKRYPEKFSFDPGASYKKRELSRLVILNQLLKERGIPVVEKPRWPRTEVFGQKEIATVTLKIDKKLDPNSELHSLTDELEELKGKAPNADQLHDLIRKVAGALPPGWEFDLRLDSDPLLAKGGDLHVEVQPFDQDLHNRDIDEMKPGWVWRFYRAVSPERKEQFSRQTQSRVFRTSQTASFDYFEEGSEEFRKEGLSILEMPEIKVFEVMIHLRRAQEG